MRFLPSTPALFAIGVLILSLVMLKGGYRKGVAYLGIAASAAVFVAMALFPVIGMGYLFWWVVMTVWLIVVGWMLYRLGKA